GRGGAAGRPGPGGGPHAGRLRAARGGAAVLAACIVGGPVLTPPRLDAAVMAMLAAREFHDGAVVNLGIGLPLACADYVPEGREVILHSEHGLMGYGPLAQHPDEADPYVFMVGNRPVRRKPGMVFMGHAESFAIVRGGHIDVTVPGGLQADAAGT